jgi:small subunit ribosomal protein S6
MNLYETIFIARQDMAPSQVDALTEKYSNIIRDGGGAVSKTEYCGLRTLAYPIKKNTKGHYVLLNIKSVHPAVAEVERQMRISDDIIRYMTVRVEELQEGPSPLLKASRNSNIRDISITVEGEDEESPAEATTPVKGE